MQASHAERLNAAVREAENAISDEQIEHAISNFRTALQSVLSGLTPEKQLELLEVLREGIHRKRLPPEPRIRCFRHIKAFRTLAEQRN